MQVVPSDSTPETIARPLMSWKPLIYAGICGGILWLVAILVAVAIFAPGAIAAKPIHAKGGRVQCHTVSRCRHDLAWHRKYERHLLAVKFPTRDAEYAIRLASAAFHVSASDMRSIARCESGMGAQVTAEAGSGASGLFQFLPSTWAHTPYAGFDVFDPFANALAAAQLVAHDGGWHQWSCSSITGVR